MATEKQREAGRKNYAKMRLTAVPAALENTRQYLHPDYHKFLDDIKLSVNFLINNWS